MSPNGITGNQVRKRVRQDLHVQRLSSSLLAPRFCSSEAAARLPWVAMEKCQAEGRFADLFFQNWVDVLDNCVLPRVHCFAGREDAINKHPVRAWHVVWGQF